MWFPKKHASEVLIISARICPLPLEITVGKEATLHFIIKLKRKGGTERGEEEKKLISQPLNQRERLIAQVGVTSQHAVNAVRRLVPCRRARDAKKFVTEPTLHSFLK